MGGALLCIACGVSHHSLKHFCFTSGVYKISTPSFLEKFRKLCEVYNGEQHMLANCKTQFETEEEQIQYVTHFYDSLFLQFGIN